LEESAIAQNEKHIGTFGKTFTIGNKWGIWLDLKTLEIRTQVNATF